MIHSDRSKLTSLGIAFSVLAGAFALVLIIQSKDASTETRSKAFSPNPYNVTHATPIPSPVGTCSVAGEASRYGCCTGFEPKGDGTCQLATCGHEGESAYNGCCAGLAPKVTCPGGGCEATCQLPGYQTPVGTGWFKGDDSRCAGKVTRRIGSFKYCQN